MILQKVNYFCVKEINETEGESWFFFIPYVGKISRATFEVFNALFDFSDHFELCETKLSEYKVNFLISRNRFHSGGYMSMYNKCAVTVSEIDLINFNNKYDDDEDGILDIWYKGQIKNYDWERDINRAA